MKLNKINYRLKHILRKNILFWVKIIIRLYTFIYSAHEFRPTYKNNIDIFKIQICENFKYLKKKHF